MVDLVDLDIIESRVDQAIENGVLTLQAGTNDLRSDPVDKLLERYFSGRLSGKARKLGQGYSLRQGDVLHCIVDLEASEFDLWPSSEPLELSLSFSVDQGVAQLTAAVILPDDYRLAADLDKRDKETPSWPAQRLSFESARLNLSTHRLDTAELKAAVKPEGPLSTLLALADSASATEALTLRGTIGFETVGDQRLPILDLTTADPVICDFGTGYSLEVLVRVRSMIDPATSTWSSRVELTSDFVTPRLTLPMVLPLSDAGGGLLGFHLDRAGPTPISALDRLADFTGVEDPSEWLRLCPGLDKAKPHLDQVAAVIDPVARQVVSLTFGVSLGLSWTILPEVLELEDLGVSLCVSYPGVRGPNRTHASRTYASFFGNLRLGKSVHLKAEVQVPDATLHASLEEGTEIDLGPVMRTLAKGLKLPVDDSQSGRHDSLQIRRLEVFGSFGKGRAPSYAFEAATAGSLEVYGGVVLEDLAMSVSYEEGSFSEAQIAGRMEWGPVDAHLSLAALR